MSQLTLENPTEGTKKGYVIKMSATLLLLMNSLCQTLDTACVSRVLLKNDFICMTKADGFRVLRREGGRGGGSEGRQETDWDSWTDALGSLALSQSGDQKLLDMLDIEAKALDEESGQDLGLIIPHMEFVSRFLNETFCCFGKLGRLQLREQQWIGTYSVWKPPVEEWCFWLALLCNIQSYIWYIIGLINRSLLCDLPEIQTAEHLDPAEIFS